MTSPTVRRAVSAIAGLALLGGAIGAVPIAAQAAPVFTFTNPATPASMTPGAPGVLSIPRAGLSVPLTGTGPDGSSVRIVTIDELTGLESTRCETVIADGAWTCPVTFQYFVGDVSAELLDVDGGVVESIEYGVLAMSPPTITVGQEIWTRTGSAEIFGVVERPSTEIPTFLSVTFVGIEELCDEQLTTDTWRCGFDISSEPDAVYEVRIVQERDWRGVTLFSEPSIATVTLDRVGPTVRAEFTTPETTTLQVTTPTYTLAGTAEPFARIRVLADATVVCDLAEMGQIQADADGRWSCTASEPATNGSYTLRIQQTDRAGNSGIVDSETVALTVTRTAAAAPPATPPRIGGSTGAAFTAPLTQVIQSTSDPFARGSESRGIIRDIIVNSVQSFLSMTGSIPFGAPVTVTIPLDLETIFAPGAGTTESLISPDSWDAVPQRSWLSLYVFSEPRLLDRQPITGDGTVTLSGVIPDDIGEGEHELVVIVEDEAGKTVEELEVRFPITVEAPEEIEPEPKPEVLADASSDTGPAWWMWLAIAAVGAGILAAVIAMARSARRRA